MFLVLGYRGAWKMQRRVENRIRLAILASISVLLLGGAVGCGEDVPYRDVGPDWMRTGKLAGLGVYNSMSDDALKSALNAMVDQHVDVVIADSSLSNYKSDAEFEADMKLLDRVADLAHQRGLKVVWYLTSLEVQTVNGRILPNSMYKDHPDWVQVGLNGKPNVFYGSQEDWVEPDDESAWMDPRSPYREYFMKRIKRLAQTKLDGIWADVPLFMDTATKWNSHSKWQAAHYKKVTGNDLPTKLDWKDPNWRRWINYRHHELNEFLLDIRKAADTVRPEFEVVIEVFTVDYNDAMDKGLDGAFMGNVKGLAKAWEIDSVSNGQGMLHASHDDWLGKVALTKFARGCDKGRPTWVFNYGNIDWDAQMVMAVAFASQSNPYETKTPNMATTVGGAFRKRMYTWADKHKDAIYDTKPAARVGLLYSSLSRDYTDHHYGFAMFKSTQPTVIDGKDPKTGKPYKGLDKEWWSDEMRDSVATLEYLGEYRGFVKLLSHLHVPFFIETMQHLKLADVQKYDLLIAPNLNSLKDDQAQMLREYVQAGGQLLVTGALPSAKGNYGTTRPELALKDALGFDAKSIPKAYSGASHRFGNGVVHYQHDLNARRYLRYDDQLAKDKLETVLREAGIFSVQTDAGKDVYVDLYTLPNADGTHKELVLHVLNFKGYDGTQGTSPKLMPQSPELTLEVPAGFKVVKGIASSPDEGAKDQQLALSEPEPGLVRFKVDNVGSYALVRLELEAAPTDGTLKVKVDWPKPAGQAPELGARVRIWGKGLLSPRTRYLAYGESELDLTGLPPGAKQVEIATVDKTHKVVGRLFREVELTAGGSQSVTVAPGACTTGPAAITIEAHDTVFVINDTAAPLSAEAGTAKKTLQPGEVLTQRFDDKGSFSYAVGTMKGSLTVVDDVMSAAFTPTVTSVSHDKGYAGHSVIFKGHGFGTMGGSVMWSGKTCTVTHWSPFKVTAYLPSDALPGSGELTVEVAGRKSKPRAFTVIPNELTPTPVMKTSFEFVRDNLRAPSGGVYTNLLDRVDPPDAAAVYPYGHHQTGEHMGLILWTSAAMNDHKTFEESFQFAMKAMMSPRRDVANWAIHKKTGLPMLQREDEKSPWLNSNAPLDDFRILKGFISGWMQWKDERYFNAALRLGNGLYETSVSRKADLPAYPRGVVAYAYNWPEENGLGVTDVAVIPIDYADLWTMKWLAQYDPRWTPVVEECTKMMIDSLIPASDQFWNSYLQDKKIFSGDFEYRDTKQGQMIKLIQTAWIGIHLARVGTPEAKAAAQKMLDFYKQMYNKTCNEPICGKFPCVANHPYLQKLCGTLTCRIPEYTTPDGKEVDYCKDTLFLNTLLEGESRVYSQLARVAYYLGGASNKAFADRLITEKILPDQVTQQHIDTILQGVTDAQKLKGAIGIAAAKDGDAEAWNNLESLIGLLIQKGSSVVAPVW
jgi:hypothetical protein